MRSWTGRWAFGIGDWGGRGDMVLGAVDRGPGIGQKGERIGRRGFAFGVWGLGLGGTAQMGPKLQNYPKWRGCGAAFPKHNPTGSTKFLNESKVEGLRRSPSKIQPKWVHQASKYSKVEGLRGSPSKIQPKWQMGPPSFKMNPKWKGCGAAAPKHNPNVPTKFQNTQPRNKESPPIIPLRPHLTTRMQPRLRP